MYVVRAISQLIIAILLVGVVVVASSLLAYTVSNLIETYQPSEVMVSRVGGVELELESVHESFYDFNVVVKIANLGSEQYLISGGKVVILIKGTKGVGKIYNCPVTSRGVLMPGEVKTILASCVIMKEDLYELFGTYNPPVDKVKENSRFLYLIFGNEVIY